MSESPQANGAGFRVLSRCACLIVSVTALGWVLHRVDLPALGRILGHGKLFWLSAGVGVFGLAFLAAAARWHLILRLSHCQVHGEATGRIVIVGHLFNT